MVKEFYWNESQSQKNKSYMNYRASLLIILASADLASTSIFQETVGSGLIYYWMLS
jgi:hypothetical protein